MIVKNRYKKAFRSKFEMWKVRRREYDYVCFKLNDKIGSIVITIGTYHRKMKVFTFEERFISTKLKTFMKLIKSFGCNFWIKMIK